MKLHIYNIFIFDEYKKMRLMNFAGEYKQNQCTDNDGTCLPCLSRLPSCVGLPNGEQEFPGRLWTPWFIECFLNRTVNIGNCGRGVFDPNIKDCVAELDKSKWRVQILLEIVILYLIYTMNKCNSKYSKVIRIKFKCICIIAWLNF